MKKCTLLLTLIAALSADLSAQYVSVQHPQLWKTGTGTIEDAVVAMTPNGAFMRYDITMTFSARNTTAFLPNDSIEVTYQFPLPAESVVNDLWLWVGKELSRGLILDRATASATYENIVKRRRDPAYLQKTYQNQYQLQIYPMVASGSRTVKFTFTAPMKKTGDQWYAAAPAYLFRSSLVPLQSLRVIYYAPSLAHIPSVLNDARYAFTLWTDSLTRVAAWKCDVPNAVFTASDPLIAVPMSAAGGYMVTQFAGSAGGTYHVLVDPFAVLGVSESRKFVVAFDYDSVKTTVPRTGYVEAMKTMLKVKCTAKDSFNVVFNDWQRSGEKWFAADSAGIASAFRTLGAATIPNGSNLPGLFMNAIEFLNSRGGSGSILLMAGSDKLGSASAADPVVAWLRQKLPAGASVHIVDVQNRNGNSYYNNGSYYYGNKYFYDAVKVLSAGMLRTLAYGEDPSAALSDVMQALSGGLSSVDLQVRFENGFSHSKYSYGIVPFQSVYANQLVGQIGKYAGSGPVTLEIAGFYRGQPFQKKVLVPEASILPADSSLRAIWVGKYISDIEWTNTAAEVVKLITDECIRERVVCRYTALLALEPGDTLIKAKNESPIRVTHTADPAAAPAAYTVASAYPNPFNPSTTLRVRLPEGVRAQDASLNIYNMLGQLVKTFDASGLTSDAYKEFRWDGVDEAGRRAASGMYLFVVATPGARHTVKLMLLK